MQKTEEFQKTEINSAKPNFWKKITAAVTKAVDCCKE
ncbi:MAG: hypothetical protein US52_C0033G0006 [candidate division WS6 bacterium GW2011_GWA2_37_6]|uniref:Uncharacterized protein n=1 Tax=candidate division WS6 bacterium GW2011_GWA2_37_6 TaxID=1619087 RepID=A0A0G0JEJ0_9BACT|nr:MAG: hypothetical protein US52_C0033G0006 [candidate division WS6 bacterium GW2011_GWA2_37_6]